MTGFEWAIVAVTLGSFLATLIAAHVTAQQDRQRYADYQAQKRAEWDAWDGRDPRQAPVNTRWG